MENICIECESNEDRSKTLSTEKYLNKIRPYLKTIVNNLEKPNNWKIQLSMAIKFIYSKKLMRSVLCIERFGTFEHRNHG